MSLAALCEAMSLRRPTKGKSRNNCDILVHGNTESVGIDVIFYHTLAHIVISSAVIELPAALDIPFNRRRIKVSSRPAILASIRELGFLN